MFWVKKPTSLGFAKILPIRCPIACAGKFCCIYKGLDEHRSIPICSQPVVSDLLCGKGKNLAGKIWNVYPWKNQKSVVAKDKMQELLPVLFLPANQIISWSQCPSRRCRKQKTTELLFPCFGHDKIAKMSSKRVFVA